MNRIKDLRIEKDINQETLGKLIGVTPQGMGLIENEKRKLDTKAVIAPTRNPLSFPNATPAIITIASATMVKMPYVLILQAVL